MLLAHNPEFEPQPRFILVLTIDDPNCARTVAFNVRDNVARPARMPNLDKRGTHSSKIVGAKPKRAFSG